MSAAFLLHTYKMSSRSRMPASLEHTYTLSLSLSLSHTQCRVICLKFGYSNGCSVQGGCQILRPLGIQEFRTSSFTAKCHFIPLPAIHFMLIRRDSSLLWAKKWYVGSHCSEITPNKTSHNVLRVSLTLHSTAKKHAIKPAKHCFWPVIPLSPPHNTVLIFPVVPPLKTYPNKQF